MFVSLSAGENILPSMGSEYATGGPGQRTHATENMVLSADRKGKRGAKGLVKAAIDSTFEWVSETGQIMGMWRADKRGF